MTEHLPSDPCEQCGGSGRLTIYDTATYIGQLCSPIGDEPCPACQPSDGNEGIALVWHDGERGHYNSEGKV